MNSQPSFQIQTPFKIHFVDSIDCEEFNLLLQALVQSTVVGLDAEWKPHRACSPGSLPPVSLFQIACRISQGPREKFEDDHSHVFLLDLQSISLDSLWEPLNAMFTSRHILKLGFKFKQDLAFLSSTFCLHGCSGFDKVEPYLDIANIYFHIKNDRFSGKPKDTKSLAAICAELLGVHMSKELQCSDWSRRPFTEEQKSYAAADAYYLLEIFTIFHSKFLDQDTPLYGFVDSVLHEREFGLMTIPSMLYRYINHILKPLVQLTRLMVHPFLRSKRLGVSLTTFLESNQVTPEDSVSKIISQYSGKIFLNVSEGKLALSKDKTGDFTVGRDHIKHLDAEGGWQGPAPWDPSIGGDGCPKFLCDVMVEGLARHLRCVGIDAALPISKKPEPRDLINQAFKEKRVLLTRDAKLLKYRYLVRNQIYRVKNLIKNDQLLEIIGNFHLDIREDQLMSRCTKCNGKFFYRPLAAEEAAEAAKGVQIIPKFLIEEGTEFWQCMDCHQLYWEGTQYQNAIRKFAEMFKLNYEQLKVCQNSLGDGSG